MPNRFDLKPEQLKQLPDPPANQARVGGVVKSSGDAGIVADVNVDIGKPGGWAFLGEGSWMRKAGGSLAGWFTWKG